MWEKTRNFLVNILLLVATLFIMAIIVEILLPFLNIRSIEEAVYIARRPLVNGIYGDYHPQIGYTLQKNLRSVRMFYPGKLDYTVDTNNHGFRGHDWDLSANMKNVVILGDSFAMGWGVEWEQTMGEIMEKELQKIDPAYQVINLAISGYDLEHIIRIIELYKNLLKPVAVVYAFCQNDLHFSDPEEIKKISDTEYDLEYNPRPNDEKIFLAKVARQQPNYWSLSKFRRRSYVAACVRIVKHLLIRKTRDFLRKDVVPKGYSFPPPITPPSKATLDEEHKKFFLYCLNRLKKNAGNSHLYLIDVGDKKTLIQKDTADNPRWVLHEFGKNNKQSVTFIDFESFIRNTPDGRKFHMDYDDHWSVAGHKTAAHLILEKMLSKKSGT
ncbi:MAG: hypothetical protein JW976_14985 [Syntrophaceae bacterium]|nr:hypothetical protein [Syntrophaceae bacterium]